MKTMITLTSLLGAIVLSASAMAQAPSSAPAGATGQCKDGSFWTGPTKKGACRGHKGVQTWYASTAAAGAGAATPPAAPAAPAAPAPTAPAPAAKKAAPEQPAATAAPGGGPGQVWVNKSSHVYHCSGDRWYGKTKNGAYMTEAAAKAEGDHADHGKACAAS